MGCCVSGASNAKVEPWPSYHDSFEAQSSTSNAFRKHVSQTGQSENEIKQIKKPSPYEDKHMKNKNEVRPRSSTARRTASTQTKESSFRSSSKSHPKEQDAITKSRISRLIQVTEADFSSTQDKTSLDKEKETTEVLVSLSQTDETRTTSDGNVEKPTPEEAVKDVSTKETKDSMELEDIEDTEESQVKDLLPSYIKSVTLEARNEIINSEVDRNTDEELKDGIPVKGNDEESQDDSREPDEALLPPASLTGKPTDNAEIDVKKEVGEDVHEACSVCLAVAPPSTVAGEEKITRQATEKEVGEEVHEVCSVCLATAPPLAVATEERNEETVTTLTEDPEAVLPDTVAADSAKELNEDKVVGEEVHEVCSVCLAVAPPSTVAGEEKNTRPATEKEVGEEVHEVCSVCLATAPPQVVATEESKEETATTLIEDPEAVLPDTGTEDSAKELNEDKVVGEEVHEACSVCLATAPPSTVPGEEKNTRPATEKEVGEEVHEVCSVCLATAPPLAVATEERNEETVNTLTEDPEAVLPDTVAVDSAKELNKAKAVGEEVHEACSVCLATAPLPSKTEVDDAENATELADALNGTEDGDTKHKVIAKDDAGEEIHEACSVSLATAPAPTITTEENRKTGEKEIIEPPSTNAAHAGTTEITEEESVGEEMHEACSVCLATAPPSTIPAVGENTKRATDKEAGEEPHEVCSVCLATGPPPTTTAEVNETKSVKEETSSEYLPTDEAEATADVEKEVGEVHEACSVCMATAPPPAPTGVLKIAHETEEKHAFKSAEKVTEEKVVGEVHEACSVCLATAQPSLVTAERPETAEEREVSRSSSTVETGADTVLMVSEGELVGEEVHEACSVCLATAPPAATVTKEEATKITPATPASTSTAEANTAEKVTTETGEREKVQEKTTELEGTDQPPSIAAEADMTGLDSNKSSTIPAERDNAEDTEASVIAAGEGKAAVNEHQTTVGGKVTAEINVPPTIETVGTEEPNESAVNTSEDIAKLIEPPTAPKEDNSGDTNEAPTVASEVGTSEATEFPTTVREDITEEGNAEATEPSRNAEDGPVESMKSPAVATENTAEATESPTIATEEGTAESTKSLAVATEDTAEAAKFQTTAKEDSTEERTADVTKPPTIATESPAESPESPAVPRNCTAGSTPTPPAAGTGEGTAEVLESPIITTENADTESPTTASEGTGEVTISFPGETGEREEGTPKISETLNNETEGTDVREESREGTGEGSAESTHFPTAETEGGNGHATASPTVATKHTAEATEIAEVTAEATRTEEVSESPTDTVEGTAEVTGSPTNVIEATEPTTVASGEDRGDKPDSTTPETKVVTSETASADTHTQDEAAETKATVPTVTENVADEATAVQGVSVVDASTKSEEPDVVMKEEGANPLDDNGNANKVTRTVTESDDHMETETNVEQPVDPQAIKVNA